MLAHLKNDNSWQKQDGVRGGERGDGVTRVTRVTGVMGLTERRSDGGDGGDRGEGVMRAKAGGEETET